MEKRESEFRNSLGENIFYNKYAHGPNDSWYDLSKRIVEDVTGYGHGEYHHPLLSKEEREQLEKYIYDQKFLPGGRYIYYAGRPKHFWNNCFLLKAEYDTREEWGDLIHRATSCLMSGGGIGIDYSIIRPSERVLSKTGGKASGPLSLMKMINEVGRYVMQGGSRRSAIYASLDWQHDDVPIFLKAKNWNSMPVGETGQTLSDIKQSDFNFAAPLDMTNISLNWNDDWLNKEERHLDPTFLENCRQALSTGEPGFSFNFGEKQNETLRNACTEVTSEDDSDVCNLGSVNFGNIDSTEELKDVVRLGSKFLVCGTIRAELPYKKIYDIREKNRRLGLGLMGLHEWLLKRGYNYEVVDKLHEWLAIYKEESENAANEHCDRLYLNRPVAYRAIAPTGTIGNMAGTTTGIEPLFSVATKRRYLVDGTKWKYQYVISPIAQIMIEKYGLDPEKIDTAQGMAQDPERRIKFQADVQDYVDMSISSTINLPAWGTKYNNENKVKEFAKILSDYAPKLRGFTCYPDGARGGQPETSVPYEEALHRQNIVYEEEDPCKEGVCGL